MVPTAKYPAIDFHGHPGNLIASADGLASLGASLDSLNVRMMVSADNLSGDRLKSVLAAVARVAGDEGARAHPRRDQLSGTSARGGRRVPSSNSTPTSPPARWASARSRRASASRSRKPDGSRLRIDDPELDPIWDECARLGLPVFIHTADPQEFFKPIDYTNERWLELSLFARPAVSAGQVSELRGADDGAGQPVPQASQDDVRRRAHGLARERPRRARRRCWTRCRTCTPRSARCLYDIGRQPRAAHDFFIKYQDRILFGKDSFQPEEYPYYWRVFETNDDYFDYYRPLPRVLEAVRHRTAGQRVEEGLLRECTQDHEGDSAEWLAEIGGGRWTGERVDRSNGDDAGGAGRRCGGGGEKPPAARGSAAAAKRAVDTGRAAPDSFRVAFETTRGNFVVQVNRAWAPLGADRFYALVGTAVFRRRAILSCGSGIRRAIRLERRSERERAVGQQAHPRRLGAAQNMQYTLTFADQGANTRSYQLFLNLADNQRAGSHGFRADRHGGQRTIGRRFALQRIRRGAGSSSSSRRWATRTSTGCFPSSTRSRRRGS